MAMEIEAKLKVDNLDTLRNNLFNLGAVNEGDCLERNWVLDDAAGTLAERAMLLRVRNMGGAGGILTVKLPVVGGEFKTREEIETMVDSTDDLLKQLAALGYRVTWLYEKIRQTWLWRDCVLALDLCPEMGAFIEIEGVPDDIRVVCGDLGLDPAAHIGDNYYRLWMRHLESRGEPLRDMTFPQNDPVYAKLSAPQTRVFRERNI